jgi:hypothetical protein
MGKLFRVTYDSEDAGCFKVFTPSGIAKFKQCKKGLHYLDLSKLPDKLKDDVCCVTTVQGNFEGFTRREVEAAVRARRLQGMLGWPTEAAYEGMVREKLIDYCPVTLSDIKNAHTIFGTDIAGLRGRTVRRKPDRVVPDVVTIPRDLVLLHKSVVLTADIMFVNGWPFLLTRSRKIQLITVEYLPNRTAKVIGLYLTRVLQLYRRAGFNVQVALMDREFAAVQAECPELPINPSAANEHVPEPERAIRLVKERARGVENTLPFEGLPKVMVIELIHFIVLWLNNFPVKSGISTKYSPRELICRHKLDAKVHCKTPFGTYCETHEEPNPKNGMDPRTIPAICLGPTGNIQGSYKFYCLKTRKKIVRRAWNELPMPKSVIERVNRHAKRDKATAKLTFADRNNKIFEFSNEEYDEPPLVEPEPSPYPDIPSEFPGVPLESHHSDTTEAVEIPPEPPIGQLMQEAAANAGMTPGADPEGDCEGAQMVEAEEGEVEEPLEDEEGEIIDIYDGLPQGPDPSQKHVCWRRG